MSSWTAIALMMTAASASETPWNLNQITRRNIPKDIWCRSPVRHLIASTGYFRKKNGANGQTHTFRFGPYRLTKTCAFHKLQIEPHHTDGAPKNKHTRTSCLTFVSVCRSWFPFEWDITHFYKTRTAKGSPEHKIHKIRKLLILKFRGNVMY